MSMDPSLKSASSLVRHRNVLSRAERLAQLTEEEKWNDSKSVYGLPKVGHRKMEVGKAVKEEVAEDGTVATPAAAGAKPGAPAAKGAAPAAKGAAPAAGAKGAPAKGAPAAKGAAPAAKAAAPAAKKK